MAQIFSAAIDLFKSVPLVQFGIFFACGIIAFLLYVGLKELLPIYLEQKKSELVNERTKNKILEDGVINLGNLVSSNTDAVKALSSSTAIFNQTFEKVSDKLYSHDERSVHLTEALKDVVITLKVLADKMPKDETIARVDEKIDNISNSMVKKEDAAILMNKLDNIQTSVAELRGRMN